MPLKDKLKKLLTPDPDDSSEIWELPDWPELAGERALQNKRIEKAKRKKERELRKKAEAEAKQKEEAEAKQKAEEEAKEKAAEEAKRKAEEEGEPKPDSSQVVVNVEEPPAPKTDAEVAEGNDDTPSSMMARGTWNNSCEFVMSLISMSVGLGNFYRFPFVAYENGGGAFLLPYILVLTFVGRPIYFLELAIGQFCSRGQVRCWDMAPIFRGVGYGSAIGSFAVVTYYSSVMGVTMFYLFNSFRAKLPWGVCDPEWAGKETCDKIDNATRNHVTLDPKTAVNLPQLYFQKKVMNEAASIDDGIGIPYGIPTACLFASWVLIFLVLVKGVQSTGKVAYFTTLYPYIIIFIMLIAASVQEGAGAGMLYFLKPDWIRLIEPQVWFAAIGQCFFSLSTGFGPIINYASYNPFHHHIYRDAVIVSFMDTLASFMAGLTVFGTLGTIALRTHKKISEVVDSGPGLVFVSFSDALVNFAYVPQLFSFLFFTMLLALAVGSAVAWQMATISVVCDRFPKLSQFWVTTVMCIAGFLVSLIYVTPGGQFMYQLVDYFGGGVNIYILTTLECIGVMYIYGIRNFCKDLEFMLNMKVSWYWKICWGFVIPVMLTIVMFYTFATAKRLTHNGDPLPDSAIISGWMLTAVTLIWIPIMAGYFIYHAKGTFKERFLSSLRPTENFGPRRPRDRARWRLFKQGIILQDGPVTFTLPEAAEQSTKQGQMDSQDNVGGGEHGTDDLNENVTQGENDAENPPEHPLPHKISQTDLFH